MKVKSSYLAISLAFALFVSGLSLPVYAESGDESKQEFEQVHQEVDEYKNKVEAKKQEAKERAEQKTAEIKAQAEAKAKEAKEKADQKRQEIRKQTCEKNADKLNNVVQKRAESARAFYERFSGFNDKIDRFIKAKNLNVADYAELSKNVADTSLKADEAIATLEGLKFKVNCENVDLVTANTQSYRDAVGTAKDALKEYKTALVNLLNGVVNSYNASNPGTTEDTNNSTDGSAYSSSDTTGENTESTDTTSTSNVNTEGPNNAQ